MRDPEPGLGSENTPEMEPECCLCIQPRLMPSLYLPQDCVQLNQYKLQSEIGKVGLEGMRVSGRGPGRL